MTVLILFLPILIVASFKLFPFLVYGFKDTLESCEIFSKAMLLVQA